MAPSARVWTFAFGLLLIGSVGRAEERPAVTDAGKQSALTDAGAYNAAETSRRSQAVAKGKGFEITLGTLEDHINKQPPALRARYLALEERKALLDNLVRLELLSAEAERRGLGSSAAVLQTVKDGSVQSLLRSEIDEKVTPESVTAADIAAFYAANAADFHHAAERRASHILVASEPEAVTLIAEAKQTDLRGFGELARKHSLDSETKLRGGDLAFFALGEGRPGLRKVAEPIRKAAFELKAIGDTVDKPVAVDGQFSIVRFSGERPERHVTVSEADASIRSRLWRERRQKAVSALIAALRAQQKPQVFVARVDLIKFDDMEKRPGGFAPDPLPRPPTPSADTKKTGQ